MIKISVEQLEALLTQQMRLVIERLLSATYMYNSESTDSNVKHLPIDKVKFEEYAMRTEFSNDIKILKKYHIE